MSPSEKVNILVVDDLPEKRLVFQTILEELNENLILAGSGEEALRCILDYEIAVVLLDVNMPTMDGFETAKMIRGRKKSAHIPIIFLTAFGDEMHTARGYSLGAVDYILAPVVPEILRTKVRVFADLFRMSQQVRRQAEERVALAREQAARAAAEVAGERLAFLAEASRVLAGSLDLNETLHQLVRLTVQRLGKLAAGILLDDKAQPLRVELARNEGGTVQSVILTSLEELPAPLPQSIWALLHRHGAGTVIPQALTLPLLARGRLLGVLAILRDGESAPVRPDDLTLAQELAGRAAIALDNARLYHNIQEGDRRKGEFLSMLAHELRNPLAPIRNAVSILRIIDQRDPVLVETRDIIDRQVTHMARLIDDLLDVSRLSHGKLLLRKEAIDFTALVRATVQDYRPTLESNGIRLEVTIPDESLWTWGDPTRLAQIIGNILHNAGKFTDAGGCVTVELARADEQNLVITIRDTGIGMDDTMLRRVFETFAQADRSLDRSKGGLGLGMALVKGLLDLHGGQVDVTSPGVGQGVTVAIRLPLRVGKANSISTPPPKSTASALRVLVIEDNRDAAESMRKLLYLMGHEAHVAHTGEEGLRMVRSVRPRVVLCDLGLPGAVDGYEFARVARSEPDLAGLSLIAVTGYGQSDDRRRSREAGFDVHLTKPVDLSSLKQLFTSLTDL